MTFDIGLLVVGALGCGVVLASGVIRKLPLSEPLVALVVGAMLGPEALDVLDLEHGLTVLHHVTEVGIAIALMAVALRFPFSTVRALSAPLTWMVVVGMVAMAAIVAGLASAVLGLGVAAAVLLGGILAPTDPVLSSSVVTGEPATEALPERVRALLSAESGFNDGLALPLVVAGMSMVAAEGPGHFAVEGLWPVAAGIVVGWAIGLAAGAIFCRLEEDREIEDSAFFVFTLVLALLTVGLVNALGGNGILAVFLAGLAYNRRVGQAMYEQEREVEEGINKVLLLPVFVLLGVVLPWKEWAELGAPVIVFAAAVLLVRRLPVVFVLRPVLRLDAPTSIFYGWFGPMGAAALFYATMAHEQHATTPEVWPATALVVVASTVAHGVTSAPGRTLYATATGRD